MKKLWIFLSIISIAAVPAFAQGKLAEAGTAVARRVAGASRSVTRGASRSTPRTNSGAARAAEAAARGTAVRGAQGSAGVAAHGTQGAGARNSNVAAAASNAAAHAPNVAAKAAMDLPSYEFSDLSLMSDEDLASYLRTLEGEHAEQKAIEQRLAFNSDFGTSVLYIPNQSVKADPTRADELVSGYSTTIIKSNYHGQEEIFGVIPTHSLPPNAHEAGIKNGVTKQFNAQLTRPDGTVINIPGEVVQISPESMLDISLVKFDPQYESLLKPLELADEEIAADEVILSPGLANGIPKLVERHLTQKSFISVRTNLIDVGGERAGFCGSPLLVEGRVKAIHTGSVEEKEASYGTHVTFVKKLIEAYHNDGKAMYDLELDGEVLTSLNIDEYISAFAIADESKQIIYKRDGLEGYDSFGKYSENKLREAMRNPQGRYLVLHSRTPLWVKDTETGEFYLSETREEYGIDWDASDYKLREHVYDLETHKLVEVKYIDDVQEDAILYQLDGDNNIHPRYY